MPALGNDSKAPILISLGEESPSPARIKVIGVGGGGGNAVNRMISAGIRGVDFLVANTDLQVLKLNRAPVKLQLGVNAARGMGAGANPKLGRDAALEDAEKVSQALSNTEMVFVTAGMGGGTGTGAAPVVARLASETGALVVAIVSKPFAFEGRRKLKIAEEGIAELREYVDTLITIPNEKLYSYVDRTVSVWEAFNIADDVLRQAVQGISDLITFHGEVNVDFADVKAVMENMGMALMGTGIATGEHRAVEAAQKAISNPLLEEQSIQGARAVLLNVTGGEDLTMLEFGEAMSIIQDAADDDANIIYGLVRDPEMKDQVKISVIATGFEAPPAIPTRRSLEKGGHTQSFPARPSDRSRQIPEPIFPDDSGFGINVINQGHEDVYEIPAFLRRQMD